jgi:hypothetical protein
MSASAATLKRSQFGCLLSGEPESLHSWSEGWQAAPLALCFGAVLVGAGAYGAAMGAWRSPLQALLVGIKFPLIILLTAGGNALLNAMLAPLLGLNLGLRQSFLAVLMSFAIACAIMGSFSPLIAFVVWNAPAMTPDLRLSGEVYYSILLLHVVVIAFAGITGNLRLYQFLRQLSPNGAVARRVLLAWLAGNLLLGSQLSWILRPFIGSPTLPVQFLRADAFQGNFYETVFHSLIRLLHL